MVIGNLDPRIIDLMEDHLEMSYALQFLREAIELSLPRDEVGRRLRRFATICRGHAASERRALAARGRPITGEHYRMHLVLDGALREAAHAFDRGECIGERLARLADWLVLLLRFEQRLFDECAGADAGAIAS